LVSTESNMGTNMKQDHNYAKIFPLLEGEDFQQLIDDIKENGLIHPITLLDDKVLDGRNRYRACLEAKVEPRFINFNGGDAVSFVISCNASRRDLTISQRACCAANATFLVNRLRKEAKARQGTRTDIPVKLPGSITFGDTRDILAKRFKVSASYVEQAFTIKALKINLKKLIEGESPFKEHKKKKHPLWKELAKEWKDLTNLFNKVLTDKLGLADAKRELDKFENAKKKVKAIIDKEAVPQIILADPPWQYDFAETDNRKIENQYDTMDLDDIKANIPVTDDNAVLFLWATQPKLREALSVMKAWGFEYKSGAIWDKGSIGSGYWFRGQHELLLVGIKGKFSPPDVEFRVSSIFKEKKTEHSKKPICVYEWIEKTFAEQGKLEMYAREVREGWQATGDEV